MFGFFQSASAPEIRVLTSRDAAVCAQLHKPAFAHSWTSEDFESMIAAQHTFGDGAFISGKLVGFCLGRQVAGEGEILTIVVRESARAKGIGKALLAANLAKMAADGAGEVFLEVESGNTPALRLYTLFGFVKVGERPAYIRMKDGTQALALIMRRAMI